MLYSLIHMDCGKRNNETTYHEKTKRGYCVQPLFIMYTLLRLLPKRYLPARKQKLKQKACLNFFIIYSAG